MTRPNILPFTRNDVRPMRSCEALLLLLLSVTILVIIFTSLFIMNNPSGYDTNTPNKVDVVLWVSSFQSFYMICVLPFCTKHETIFKIALVPYLTMLILSTNIFIQNDGISFDKGVAIYHFINLIANYIIVLIGCNASIYYRYHALYPGNTTREYIVHYNVVPSIKQMTTKECVNEVCSICMEHITSKQLNIITECGHTFHKQCIDRWLSFHNDICPNCRKNIIT